jgi:hypothetical protein
MGFDIFTRTLLEIYTTHAPPTFVDHWYGPWNTILNTLFPPSQGYVINPRRSVELPTVQIPDLVIEVSKLTLPFLAPNRVLIFQMKNTQHWDHGVEDLMQKIRRQTDHEFGAYKLYWIVAIGPHWVYGEKCGEQDPKPLIEWHDVTHDDASYRDLLQLVELVVSWYKIKEG